MKLKDKGNKTIIKNMVAMLMIGLTISIPLIMIKGIRYGDASEMNKKHSAYLIETADTQPNMSLSLIWPGFIKEKVTRESIRFLKEKRYNVFREPSYQIPPQLFNDSLGRMNEDILRLPENMLQFTPDYLKIITPAITPAYQHKITNLYIDIDGQIYPLYYSKSKLAAIIPRIKNITYYPDTNGESFIASKVIKSEIHRIKIKSLTKDGMYYITDLN
jgi:hypothetical protein